MTSSSRGIKLQTLNLIFLDFIKKVLVVLVLLVDSVSSVVLVITFHVIRWLCLLGQALFVTPVVTVAILISFVRGCEIRGLRCKSRDRMHLVKFYIKKSLGAVELDVLNCRDLIEQSTVSRDMYHVI